MSKIVIVGAGFAGLFAVVHLRKRALHRMPLEVTIFGKENFFLFTPMLYEVVTGEVEPAHIATPIRSFFRGGSRFRFHQATVTDIDFEGKKVTAFCEKGHCLEKPYDYLVLATGGEPNLPQVSEKTHRRVFPFLSLSDAILLHNQVIDMFEHAEMVSPKATERKKMLTFVVVGGGYAGIEVATGLHDMFYDSLLPHYPNVNPGEIRLILCHAESRLLPELGSELANFATEKIYHKQIELKLGTKAELVENGVKLDNGEVISARTIVWTTGARPSKLVQKLPCEKDSLGRIKVDDYFKIKGKSGAFAIGDCAHQINKQTGQAHPPTAQIAIRQARLLANNILADINGSAQRAFMYQPAGVFLPLGRHSAVAILKGLKLKGFVAWWLHKALYLMRIPAISNRIRIVIDWTLDLFFKKSTLRITIR